METMETILTRRSVRRFTDQHIDEDALHMILEAGMSGPSCTNARDWSFLVVRDKRMLERMADANGRPAEPLRGADCGIMVCGDLSRAFPMAKDYWVIDGSIAAQNMILCAHSLGIGSVWLGTWPQMERVEQQAALFSLPKTIIPHSILAFGYPADTEPVSEKERYEEDRVHYEKW